MKLHERVRAARIAKGMTITQLAILVGARRATISDFENGKRSILSGTLDKILRVLEVEI